MPSILNLRARPSLVWSALIVAFAVVAAACTTSADSSDGGFDEATAPTEREAPLEGSGADAEEPSGGDAGGATETPDAAEGSTRSYAGSVPAPEFPAGLDWLNTDRPLALDQLLGKVVLLDFWTYGCINCIHVIPDLKRLEAEYPDELVVIGVHSAKFENESNTENIRQIILRYEIEHPVVNDGDFTVWRNFGVQAWPTIFAIDPAGNVVGYHSGEGVYEVVQPVVAGLIDEFGDEVDRTPLDLVLESEGLPETVLSFPGKVTVDAARDRLYISDTNHHRVVATTIDGVVVGVFGSGVAAMVDGTAIEAAFSSPQGTALSADGATLYVADTGNHSVRRIDLASGAVSTVTGSGNQAAWPPRVGQAPDADLASPWDLELDGDVLYIAMAGTHQIWSMDLATGVVGPFAGSGAEGTRNTDLGDAELAQPSGLALADDGRLFFTDSESSAIRWADTVGTAPMVGVLAGSDASLFEFGDLDGTGTAARLQHPLGVAVDGDTVWIADTYNSKIKRIDAATGEVVTFVGGAGGWRDGADPLFFEPGGIEAANGVLYVADTNNHAIRTVDPTTGVTETIVLSGIGEFLPTVDEDGYTGTVVALDPVEVGAGAGSVVVELGLPSGYKVNPDAPSNFEWSADGPAVAFVEGSESVTVAGPAFPFGFAAEFVEGEATVVGDLLVVYCEEDAESICLIEQVRLAVPVVVTSTGDSDLRIRHEIDLPDLDS